LVLGIPVACVAWTVTHEEVFREPRQYCQRECTQAKILVRRKFFYLVTCEYCFSHYVAGALLMIVRYKLLLPDWRGYVVAFFALVWVANQYMRTTTGYDSISSMNRWKSRTRNKACDSVEPLDG